MKLILPDPYVTSSISWRYAEATYPKELVYDLDPPLVWEFTTGLYYGMFDFYTSVVFHE
jgi:hypothetical protein